jgi:hypothetical protein
MKSLEQGKGHNLGKDIRKAAFKVLLAGAATSVFMTGCQSGNHELKPVVPIETPSGTVGVPGVQEVLDTKAENITNEFLTPEAAKKYGITEMKGINAWWSSQFVDNNVVHYGGPKDDSIIISYNHGLQFNGGPAKVDQDLVSITLDANGNLGNYNAPGTGEKIFGSEQIKTKMKELFKIPQGIKLQEGLVKDVLAGNIVPHENFEEVENTYVVSGSWTQGNILYEVCGDETGNFEYIKTIGVPSSKNN